ncbi:hypothetical protein R7U59_01260 [Mesomycoplasma ovipneumoniae]|uniref:Uncharacterized protein n=1 Tax=Mesomycoplasma ovipneumoniae TaxID=29562 RepID=A0AAJ2UE11_9BACT|nr:hypothetical protein [Mesomycoplasma ovipneumoniae]MDW2835478.1 hypothetical protein [Mesomycoplasma ovipneumoniae]MDW2891661.1 hypothetical protein [Mesomycoplasma ovipneumoniae]MDW2898027.1 hypothetical protein [Mesomycoplasma ovipneumoniae]
MSKNSKRNFWTFFSLGTWLWIQSSILVGVGGYLFYVYDVQNQKQLAKISEYRFWNDKKNVLTFEGDYPRFFIDNINKLTDEELKTKIDSKKPLNFNDFRDEYVFVYKDHVNKNQFLFKKKSQESENNKQLHNTYLIKNKQDLVDLIIPNKQKLFSTNDKPDVEILDEKEVNELSETIDLSNKDAIILNNYVSDLSGSWGDRRAKGLNLVDFNFNENTKTIELKWKFEDYRKRSAVVQAIGYDDWFKSYVLLIDKNKIDSLDNIKFTSAFS